MVLLRALLCPAALLAAAAAETSGYVAPPFAGGVPLLFPGVLVVQVLQCFPGLLLLLLLHLTQNPLRQQRTSRRAVCRKHESAERGARCNEKMKAPPASASQSARSAVQRHLGPDRPIRLTKSSAFGPSGLELDLGSRKGGPRTSKRRAAFCTLCDERYRHRMRYVYEIPFSIGSRLTYV